MTYQTQMHEFIQQPFNDLISGYPDVKKAIKNHADIYNPQKDSTIQLKVQEDITWGNNKKLSACFILTTNSPTMGVSGRYFSFSLDYYPVCCAVKQLNNFSYGPIIEQAPQEFFDKLVDLCIQTYDQCLITDIRRVVMNFVGIPKNQHSMSSDLDVEDSKVICYDKFYKWAKSKPHMNEMVFRNHNTGNNIHMAQILIKE